MNYEEAVARLARHLERVGVNSTDCRLAAEIVLEGEVKKGLGLFMICQTLKQVQIHRPSEPRIIHETAVSALIHGGNQYGEVAGPFAMREGLKKGRNHGLAIVGMTDFHPFPLLSSITERVAVEGFVCFLFSSTPSVAVPFHGVEKSLGTNPVAISIPRRPTPFTMDMATTNVTLTQVRKAAESNTALPEGITVDARGQPTTDAKTALEGALTVFGGHKGSALSLMISLLAGPLLGIESTISSHLQRGMLMILFSPDLLGSSADLQPRIEEALRVFRQRGNAEFCLPGEPEAASLERARRVGLEIPEKYAWLFG